MKFIVKKEVSSLYKKNDLIEVSDFYGLSVIFKKEFFSEYLEIHIDDALKNKDILPDFFKSVLLLEEKKEEQKLNNIDKNDIINYNLNKEKKNQDKVIKKVFNDKNNKIKNKKNKKKISDVKNSKAKSLNSKLDDFNNNSNVNNLKQQKTKESAVKSKPEIEKNKIKTKLNKEDNNIDILKKQLEKVLEDMNKG